VKKKMCESENIPHGPAQCGCGPHPFMHMHYGGPQFQWLLNQNWETFMPYDLSQTDDQYLVTMPLPGFESKNIQVSIKGKSILIEATKPEIKKEETSDKSENGPKTILSIGRFIWDKNHVEVEIPVDEDIVPDNAKAKLVHGMLNVTFKRKPGTKVNVEGEATTD
jgi:HSP20 family molecular chaperone IbpA